MSSIFSKGDVYCFQDDILRLAVGIGEHSHRGVQGRKDITAVAVPMPFFILPAS